jgi:hypothetical protein
MALCLLAETPTYPSVTMRMRTEPLYVQSALSGKRALFCGYYDFRRDSVLATARVSPRVRHHLYDLDCQCNDLQCR